MDPPMVDCRSLIEFCRTFVQRQNSLENRANSRNRRSKSLNPLSHPFCEHSPLAVMDIFVLFVVIAALGILIFPYLKLILEETYEFLPIAFDLIGGAVSGTLTLYAFGLLLLFALAIALWEVIGLNSRKCGNPYCRGLKNAVEFDIQLEPEECVKHLTPLQSDVIGSCPFELGEDHNELEAELKKMAPVNGRTVLIFRSRCGCPRGRMEVWGYRKIHRAKR